MFNVHHDAVMLPLSISTQNYAFGNEKLPAVSASASKDKQGLIHISLVNIDAKTTQTVQIDMRGTKANAVSGRILTGAKVQDHNTFDNPNKVQPSVFNGAKLSNNIMTVAVPPFSVVVLEVK
jgi:alpha-L-arabinofuranosidase